MCWVTSAMSVCLKETARGGRNCFTRCWGEGVRQKVQEQNPCLHGVVTRSRFLWTHVRPGRFFSVDLGNLEYRRNLALTSGGRDFIGGKEQIEFTAVCLLTTRDPAAVTPLWRLWDSRGLESTMGLEVACGRRGSAGHWDVLGEPRALIGEDGVEEAAINSCCITSCGGMLTNT